MTLYKSPPNITFVIRFLGNQKKILWPDQKELKSTHYAKWRIDLSLGEQIDVEPGAKK
jgi:hypothetical protein